jgi:T5SS/PEP-CTERM-associated repeat protein
MSRAALLGATCLSGLALAASITPSVAEDVDLILNAGQGAGYFAYSYRFGSVIVGDGSGPATLTVGKNPQLGDAVFVSKTSILGNSTTANGNQATVSGTWNTNGNFILGDEGSGNKLNIEAGGKVSASDSYIGDEASSTGNIATVTGAGSEWNAGANLHVGYEGASNELKILNGGKVTSSTSWVGNEATAGKNIVTVSGNDSSWTTSGDFILGKSGGENKLNVTDGASVSAHWLTIGASSADNSMTVDGASRLDAFAIVVGSLGGANTLTLSNGAKVTSVSGIIGDRASANGNMVTVSGDAQWDIQSEDEDNASWLFVGDGGSLNRLELSEGGKVNVDSGLVIGGFLRSEDSEDFDGGDFFGNTVFVAGSQVEDVKTRLTSAGLLVGGRGSSNRVEVLTGGYLETKGDAQIGGWLNTNNSVTVSGARSLWTVSGNLVIRDDGPPPQDFVIATATDEDLTLTAAMPQGPNRLTIENGGHAFIGNDLVLQGNGMIDLGAGAVLEAGSLTLSDNSLLSIYLDDKRDSRITVTGQASLDGDLDVKLGTADLQRNSYTVLTAGSVTGTFDSFDLLPMYLDVLSMTALNARLEYTLTSVNILFDSDIGGDEDLNRNQSNVSDAINRYYNNDGEIPLNFVPLLTMTGDTLFATLDQISGEVGATGGANQMQQGQDAFLGLLVQQDAAAPQASDALASSSTSIYGMTVMPTADAPPSSGWTMWGSAFGGKSSLPGEGVPGSHDTDTDLVGLATGWTHALSNDASFGFAIAGGGTRWDLAEGLGNGESTFLQFGAHGTQRIGASYLSVAGAYAWHWMETERRALGETLEADFAASSLAGRLEGGHRFGEKGDLGFTPYAAVTAQANFLPDYEESGGSAALAFEEKTATSVRSELGLRIDHTTDTLRLDAGLAWAHDWRSDASAEAAFRSLPGASFMVNGAEAPDDIALVTAGAEFGLGSQTTLSARFDGEFGQDYTTYGGKLALSYNW